MNFCVIHPNALFAMSEKPDHQFDGSDKITIADLYPELTSEQQADAEYRLLGYLEIVNRIFEQVCLERPDILTELERRAMLRKKRSPPRNR